MKVILSLSGGGIRGLVEALVLEELERRIDKPLHEAFDFVAGTSTGGIIALGIAKGLSASKLVSLYEQQGSRIFSRTLKHKLLSLWSLAEEKYPAKQLEGLLGEYFEDTYLSQALTEVMVTSYDMQNSRPYFFKSHKARIDSSRDHRMSTAARATSAAPTFFEPVLVGTDACKPSVLVDGGVGMNNPTMCAYVEAQKLFPGEELFMFSLGCGESCTSYTYNQVKGFGLAKWARPILGTVFDCVNDAVDYQVSTLLEGNYVYIQPALPSNCMSIDNASPVNLLNLRMAAQDAIQKYTKELTIVADVIKSL